LSSARDPSPVNASADATLRHSCGNRYILTGTIDYPNAGRLLADGKRHFAGQARVVVDLTSASAANSVGLAVLMEWAAWCDKQAIPMAYEGASPELVALAGLNDVARMLPLAAVPG